MESPSSSACTRLEVQNTLAKIRKTKIIKTVQTKWQTPRRFTSKWKIRNRLTAAFSTLHTCSRSYSASSVAVVWVSQTKNLSRRLSKATFAFARDGITATCCASKRLIVHVNLHMRSSMFWTMSTLTVSQSLCLSSTYHQNREKPFPISAATPFLTKTYCIKTKMKKSSRSMELLRSPRKLQNLFLSHEMTKSTGESTMSWSSHLGGKTRSLRATRTKILPLMRSDRSKNSNDTNRL